MAYMVYGTYNIITIVTGANLNQLKTGGPHIALWKIKAMFETTNPVYNLLYPPVIQHSY